MFLIVGPLTQVQPQHPQRNRNSPSRQRRRARREAARVEQAKKSAQYGTEEVETCGNSSKALEASYEFVDNNIELAEEAHKEQSNDTVSDAVVEETIAADDANPDPQNVISF